MSENTKPTVTLAELRALREGLDRVLGAIDTVFPSRYLLLAKTEAEVAKMWLGKAMGEAGGEDLNAQRDAKLSGNKD